MVRICACCKEVLACYDRDTKMVCFQKSSGCQIEKGEYCPIRENWKNQVQKMGMCSKKHTLI